MLTVYRRHRSKCKFADDRISKKCRCALWAKGTIEGEPYQKSLKTRSFERAQQIVRDIEDGGKAINQITIKDATEKFLADCQARNLKPNTIAKYRRLATGLQEFAAEIGVSDLRSLTQDQVRDFRQSWKLAPRTVSKTLEKLRSFFRFCVENGWLQASPAKNIKPPQVRQNPTLPFSDAEVAKILVHAKPKEAVFFRLLLHSGLRILDAATLRPERIQDGKLFLYQQKTGQPVWIPLPPDLVQDLGSLRLTGGFYFAVESDKPASVAEYYRVRLKKAAKKAEVKDAHPHRFRDTFAVRLLEKGVSLEHVSILLGHTDIKTTQRAYYPWVRSLQDNLEREISKTWEKPKLALVKTGAR